MYPHIDACKSSPEMSLDCFVKQFWQVDWVWILRWEYLWVSLPTLHITTSTTGPHYWVRRQNNVRGVMSDEIPQIFDNRSLAWVPQIHLNTLWNGFPRESFPPKDAWDLISQYPIIFDLYESLKWFPTIISLFPPIILQPDSPLYFLSFESV